MKLINIIFSIIILNLFEKIFNESYSKVFQKKNNLRKLSDNQNYILDIEYSQIDNYYYIQFYLGEDHIPQIFILDTTFPIISSPCNLCENCKKKIFPFYLIDYEKDIYNCYSQQCYTFFNLNSCGQEKCYFKIDNNLNNNKNIEGYLVNSKIYINNTYTYKSSNELEILVFNTPIGCTIKENIFFENTKANGIIGLNNNKNTIIDKMYNLDLIKNNLFSICLSKNGGYLSLGKINDNIYYNNLNYINILSSSSVKNIFEFNINYIEIEEEKILQESISYIDSTNLFSYFPENIYNFIFQTLKKGNKTDLFSYDYQNNFCRMISDKNAKNNLYEIFPNIIINFENYNFEWKSNNYLIESEIEENNIFKICLGIKKLSENNGKIVLGTNFMIGNDIIFDKTNQKIAFIKSNCDQKKISINDEIIKNKNDTNFYENKNENNNNSVSDELNIENILKNESNNISLSEEINIENILKNESNNSRFSEELSIENILKNESNINNTLLETSRITDILINEDYLSYIYSNKNESNNSNKINLNESYKDFISNIYEKDDLTIIPIQDTNNISDFIKEDKTDFINTNTDFNESSTIINIISNNNTLITKTSNIITSLIKSTINTMIINSTSISSVNIPIIGNLNNTIIEKINDSIILSTNIIIINSTMNNNINITNIISSNLETYFENKSENINLINFTTSNINIFSSTIKNKELELNFDTDKKFTDDIFLSDTIISSDKNQENQTESITQKAYNTEIINDEKKNNLINKNTTNTLINIETENNNDLKDKTFMGNAFDIFKSFLKNKLIYFFLALLGVVLCFAIVILISCAIISCFKMFKRRNYMEQMDIDVPGDKYNTNSLSS